MSNPIQPASQPQPPAPPVPTQSPSDVSRATINRTVNITTRATAQSPLKGQQRDLRGQPGYNPCELIILNGEYQGQSIDLGLAVNSTFHEQSANWRNQSTKGIREGINFDGLSPREIRIELDFVSLSEDVFHLLENIAALQEIGGGERQPPFLMWVQGSARIAPVVCTGFTHTLEYPHPGRKGFRHGRCEIRLLLPGGKDSEHSLGKPLTAIPAGDIRDAKTRLENQQRSQVQVANLLLAPCIGERGSREVETLIQENRLNDPAAYANLSPETITQIAIAGIIPKSVLENPFIRDKVKAAIAASMAAAEPGISYYARVVADGLLTGNFGGISDPRVLQQAIQLKSDFDAISSAVLNRSPGSVLRPGNTAGERLRRFGACGLSLRNTGALQVRGFKNEGETLDAINTLIAEGSDSEIRRRFGVSTDDEIRAIKNGGPYQDRNQFIEHLSRGGSINAVALWSRFEQTTATTADSDTATADSDLTTADAE